jgi:hypothetical protein
MEPITADQARALTAEALKGAVLSEKIADIIREAAQKGASEVVMHLTSSRDLAALKVLGYQVEAGGHENNYTDRISWPAKEVIVHEITFKNMGTPPAPAAPADV